MKRIFIAAATFAAAVLATFFASGCSTILDRRVEKELSELTAASCAKVACRLSLAESEAAQQQLFICVDELQKGCQQAK